MWSNMGNFIFLRKTIIVSWCTQCLSCVNAKEICTRWESHYHKFFRLRATIGFNLRGKTDSHLIKGKQDTPEQGDPFGKGIVEKLGIRGSYMGDWTRDGQEIP